MAEKEKDDKPKPPMAPVIFNPIEQVLSGGNVRGEVAGCPTGLSGGIREVPPREGEAAPGAAKQPDTPPAPKQKKGP